MRYDATTILIAALATLALYAVPGLRLLARPLVLFATLVHELAHGLAAMLVGGSFEHLRLWANGSGAATYRGRFTPGALALIAAAGPLGPPGASLALFWAGASAQHARIALYALAATTLLVALIWVRNGFGIVFVLGLGMAFAALAHFMTEPSWQQFACVFLAVQMALSTFARADYLFKSQARTAAGEMPSDTAQIAAALGGAPWFWGGVLALVSLAFLALGIWLTTRRL